MFQRVYALDIMGPVMVVVTADRKLLAYQMHPEPKEWQPFLDTCAVKVIPHDEATHIPQ